MPAPFCLRGAPPSLAPTDTSPGPTSWFLAEDLEHMSASAADRCETCSMTPGLKSSDRCKKGSGAQKAGVRGQEDVKGNCEGGWGKPSSWGTTFGLERAPGWGGAGTRVFGAQSTPRLSEAPPICICRTAWSYGEPHPAHQGLGSAGTEGRWLQSAPALDKWSPPCPALSSLKSLPPPCTVVSPPRPGKMAPGAPLPWVPSAVLDTDQGPSGTHLPSPGQPGL